MKIRFICSAILLCLTSSGVYAQEHTDIEFAYDDLDTPSRIEVEAEESTSAGVKFFEGDFTEALGDVFAQEPGFESDNGITEGHKVYLRALDARSVPGLGVGFVNFYNPNTDSLEAAGRIAIQDGESADASDWVLDGTSASGGDMDQLVTDQVGSDNFAHGDLFFDLLDDSDPNNPVAEGAYGMMLQLRTHDANDNFFAESEAFWLVLNHGMSPEDFRSQAVVAFGVTAVPEPSSAMAILFGLSVVGMKRRRKS